MLHTPVALIIFNRPATTERVFVEMAKAKPTKLFIIADGPRPGHPEDIERCAATRAIIERVDWDCQVLKNYSDVNLGCGKRPATGITWLFERADRAIILEDDCVPHPSFFRFCEELLEKHYDDERIMMIGGINDLFREKRLPYSYFFGHTPTCCGGWATWRRAWQHFDIEIKLWCELRETSWLNDLLGDPRIAQCWQHIFDRAYAAAGNVDYWDYQWTFSCWTQHGFGIFPNNNLTSNIGFGVEGATHTGRSSSSSVIANIPTVEMQFPLRHPPCLVWDSEADRIRLERDLPKKPSLYRQLRRRLSSIIPDPLRELMSQVRYKSKDV